MGGKNKSSKPKWGKWSDWQWHEEYNTYYRVRKDDKGHYEYDYRNDIPRTPGDDGIRNLTDEFQATTVEPNYTTDPDPGPERKGKGKATAAGYPPLHEEEVTNPPAAYTTSYIPSYSSGQYPSTGVQEDVYPDDNVSNTTHATYSYAYGGAGEASTSTYGHPEDGIEGQPSYYANQESYQQYPTESTERPLDSRFGVHYSEEFQPGKILKIYWSEPKGSKKGTTISHGEEVHEFGGLIYQGFRRFIVIASDQGHSSCVPILTYGSRACAKPGIKARKHGVIHDERKKPKLVAGEPELGFKPVRARMYEDTETLAKESRVNYSKTSTIEHNSVVWFIGEVHPEDFRTVTKAYNKCWEGMNQGQSHRRRY